MKEIILDARSSNRNDTSTGLALREVLDRGAYVGGLRGDLMFLSEGNGKIIDRDVSVSELGEGSFLEVRGGDVLYGGVRGLSEGDYVKRGVVRFSGDFDLLGGGNR